MVILVVISHLDRTNIGNARVFGFEEGIGLHGTQFNNISMLFYVLYIVFEIPWVMAVKRWGANRILAIAFVCWSAITLGTGFIHNYRQAVAMRLLLGLFEGGLFPSLTFVISTIYDRKSQAKRVAVLYGSNALSGAFGGLIAYGIQLMGDRRGLEAWRWLFIVEGCISMVLCALSWVTLPTNAEKAWFLNTEEKALMEARKYRDIVYKGDDRFQWAYMWMALKDPFIYIAGFGLFCASIPLFGFATFLPTIIKGLGYTSLEANYFTIPVYLFGCVTLAITSSISDYLNKRAIIAFCVTIPVIIGYAIVVGTANHGVGYFAMFLCGGGIYSFNTTVMSWVSNNLSPDYKRSVGIPLFASLANISGLIASQIYPSPDGPRYVTGNAISMSTEVVAMLMIVMIWLLLRRREAEKERMRQHGTPTNGMEDDRGLDFKYTL
ncbi:hypothetical protein AJ79_05737 [Neofusicoccum parvum]|uniref:Uncharacterized protein n=1 Tax=Neofusicoccum parvum TaxID=310453 RepID=A0ACB5RUD2_9PEZI|nr:hypothetical protein AJ79_05737 [Neofusicoccum parvum]